MSTFKKMTLALLGFLVSLASIVSAVFRYRAASADKKIRVMEIADGANAATQQARLQELARIKAQLDAIPGVSVTRTQKQIDAQLRSRGLLK